MKKLIIYLFHFELMQFRYGRKYIKGTFYYVFPEQLCMAPFWTDQNIKSVQCELLQIETYK